MVKKHHDDSHPLENILNEAAAYEMLRRLYTADPEMDEGTKVLMRTVFAVQERKNP